MIMKRLLSIFAVAMLVLSAMTASAQSRTSYFMEGSYFRTDLNPALAPTRGYIALPVIGGIGIDVPNNFLSVDNFIYQKDSEMVTALHSSVTPNEFLGKLPDVGRLGVNANVNLLGVGFYTGKFYWNFGARLRSVTDITMSKEVFSALKTLGNGTYNLGDTGINSNNYLEAYFGTSIPIGKHVNIGARAKFLVGLLNLHTEFDEIKANVAPERISAQLRGRIVANSIVIDQAMIKPGDELSMDMLSYTDVNALLNRAKSFGAAIDLGVELKFFKNHLKVSAAVTDLGFIKWNPTTNYSASASADFAFEGFTFDENFKVNDPFSDAKFEFQTDSPSREAYETMLNGALNVGLEFNFLRNHFALGVMSHTEMYNNRPYSELTASLNIRPNSWITATVSHTFLENNGMSVYGAALNLHPRALNIFVGVDFFDTQYGRYGEIPVPRYQNSVNVYAGIGFNFARPKFIRDAVKQARVERREAREVRKEKKEQKEQVRQQAKKQAKQQAKQAKKIKKR